MTAVADLTAALRHLHDELRDGVVRATEKEAGDLVHVSREDEADTIYAIDAITEDMLLRSFASLARQHTFVLVGEGLGSDARVFPDGISESEAAWRIIVDPIDGSRGLMYQKRSAWILTGVAPNRGPETSLQDIVLAIQTEIPLVKQHLCDQVWATRGGGAQGERFDRVTRRRRPLPLGASTEKTIAHGFFTVSRFFPGTRAELSAIDDEIVGSTLGPQQPGKAQCFEDQYISSGGQMYELMVGHDRFIADLRPLMRDVLAKRGAPAPLCAHPYDLCSALIASELGVVVTDAAGRPLDAPLDLCTDVAWVGYANHHIRQEVEPRLQEALRRRGLLG